MFWFKRRGKSVAAACKHSNAVPRWDHVEEAGDPERISRFYCPDCDQFVPASALTARTDAPFRRPGPP